MEVIAMIYRPFSQGDGKYFYTEPYSRCRFPYHTVKEMHKKYPDGNFVIIGEIGSNSFVTTEGDWLLLGDGKTLPIFPRGSLKKYCEWIIGYIAVEKDTYIAVVSSMFPSFLRRGLKSRIGSTRRKDT